MSTYDENKTLWCFLALRHDIKWNTMPLIMQYTMYIERLNRCCLKRYMENYKIQICKRICMRMCACAYMVGSICGISRVLTADVKLVWHIQSLSHEFRRCCQHAWYDLIIINTWRPRKKWPHFADDTYSHMFVNENVWVSINSSQKFVPKDPIFNNISALVQIMALRRPGDKPLS